MNRPSPTLDAALSAMVLGFVAAGFALAVAAAFLTGLAIGKLVVVPLASMLTGMVA
jgi:hypothetical protein